MGNEVKTIQITDGFQLTVGYAPLGESLSRHDQDGNGTLTVADFRLEGDTDKEALEKMWKTVADEVRASKLFKNPQHADRLLGFFRDYHLRNSGRCVEPTRDTLFQESTIAAFSGGAYVGHTPVESIKKNGDIGLGTFDSVNGEQIHLDGVVYQGLADSNNTTRIAAAGERTPFSINTFFDAELFLTRQEGSWTLDSLNRELDTKIGDSQVPIVFEINASFSNIVIRSIAEQEGAHRPFKEVTKEQEKYVYKDVQGTLIAIWTPQYMEGIGVPGYHYHFISDDKTRGGHVLSFETQPGASFELKGDPTCGVNLKLSKNYVSPFVSTNKFSEKIPPIIIPHRGGKAELPENTLYAFEELVGRGFHLLEIDVQVTHDGELVIFHPQKATSTGKGISDLSLEDVQAIDFSEVHASSSPFNFSHPDIRIPTLGETLERFPDVEFVIDLKSPDYEMLIDALVNTLNPRDWERLLFYSTEGGAIDYLLSQNPNAEVFEKREDTLSRLLDLNPPCDVVDPFHSSYEVIDRVSLGTSEASFSCSSSFWRYYSPSSSNLIGYELNREKLLVADGSTEKEFTWQAWTEKVTSTIRQQTKGAVIFFFGIDSPQDFCRAIEMGADYVFSNNPLELMDYRCD